ncbi:MAG: MaoC family dehydratase [Steroidobacteraceae bacterium]
MGRNLGSSDWILITQERINEFARVTGDHQWMHVDIERATRERGGTIAHGLLIASLLPLMSEQIASVSGYSGGYSYGFDKLRFTHPVRCGQRVRLQQTFAGVEARQGGQVVTLKCVVEIDGEPRPALVADYLALYFL